MNIDNITDKELMAFCVWFATFHGSTTAPSVFTTCICGHFHTYTKAAKQVLNRCMDLNLITVKRNSLTIEKSISKRERSKKICMREPRENPKSRWSFLTQKPQETKGEQKAIAQFKQ